MRVQLVALALLVGVAPAKAHRRMFGRPPDPSREPSHNPSPANFSKGSALI
jgi:hypothetical protein